MPKQANQTSFKPGQTGNPGGLTKEHRELRDRTNAILLTTERTAKWLESYDGALADRVPAILLDYTYRVLGKPPETVNVSNVDTLVEALRGLPSEQLLKYIDDLAVKEPPK